MCSYVFLSLCSLPFKLLFMIDVHIILFYVTFQSKLMFPYLSFFLYVKTFLPTLGLVLLQLAQLHLAWASLAQLPSPLRVPSPRVVGHWRRSPSPARLPVLRASPARSRPPPHLPPLWCASRLLPLGRDVSVAHY